MITNSPFFLELSRTIAAPRDRVFQAMTQPDYLSAWWAPKGWCTPHVEVDVRVGGKYRFGMRSETDPAMMFVHGEYLEVDPPRRLVFTYIWEPEGAGARWIDDGLTRLPTTVTIDLIDVQGKTQLTIRHEGFPTPKGRDQHREGWWSNFECLEDYLLKSIVKPFARS
jgi:uncharacterized protein YndB with AHSA1/START domain